METHNLIRRIRDLVNAPRIQHEIMKDRDTWLQLCSCMDTIDDCAMAVQAYRDKKGAKPTNGELYLATYGIFQCLFVQQDAVGTLGGILKSPVDISKDRILGPIRTLRNRMVGHPTDYGHGKDSAPYNFLVQCFLTIGHVQVHSMGHPKSYNFQPVDVFKILDDQENVVNGILESAIRAFLAADQNHKERFVKTSVKAIFEPTTYALEKIHEAIFRPENAPIGEVGLNMLEGSLWEFQQELTKREIWGAHDSAIRSFNDAKRPIEVLRSHFSRVSVLAEIDARIYAAFLRECCEGLREVAGWIDDDYRSASK